MNHNLKKTDQGLNESLAEIKKIVDPVIKELLPSYVDKERKQIVNYQISTGGKRLRPALAIISCKLLGGKIGDVLYPAAGLEIMHNYSLIVDDIIDNSSLRRDKPTAWSKFGTSIAQCLAIDYSATILQAANKSKKSVLISELFAKTMKAIVDGEILDILFEQFGREEEPYIIENRYKNIKEKDYFKMAGKKTAALFQTCCEVGGICANGSEKEIAGLAKYGFNLGIAFQIQDDTLDTFGEEKKFGKEIGKDIKERKGGSIIIILALKELKDRDKNRLVKIIEKRNKNKSDVKEAVSLIKSTQALNKANKLAKGFIKKAQNNLDALPKNKWSKYLKYLSEFVIRREK